MQALDVYVLARAQRHEEVKQYNLSSVLNRQGTSDMRKSLISWLKSFSSCNYIYDTSISDIRSIID